MRSRYLWLMLVAWPLTCLHADDPLALTLPSGKTLHFATAEQKAKFEAARARAAQPQPIATPTPTPIPATPTPATFPPAVVLTRSVALRSRHGQYSSEETLVPVGTTLRVHAVAGLYLEVEGGYFTHYLVPLEWTDYMSRNVPQQPPVSHEVAGRIAGMKKAEPVF